MSRLLLVRHGESRAQAEGFVGGPRGCTGLSDLGRRQVEALRDRWREQPPQVDVLVASTLPRAVETAEILNAVLGHPEVVTIEGLCEIRPGECDGMAWTEFEARFTGSDYRWDPHRPLSEGGESWVTFQERATAALQALVDEHAGRTVVAAVHGGIVEASMVHFLGLPKDAGSILDTTNSSVTEWRRSDGTPGWAQAGWRLARFNDHAHLEALDG